MVHGIWIHVNVQFSFIYNYYHKYIFKNKCMKCNIVLIAFKKN